MEFYRGKNLIVTSYLRPPLHIKSSRVVALEEMGVTVSESSLSYVTLFSILNFTKLNSTIQYITYNTTYLQ